MTLTPKLFSAAWITGYRRHNGSHHHTSPCAPCGFACRRPACLTTENHLRGRLPFCVTPALTYYRIQSQQHTASNPRRSRKPARRRLVLTASVLAVHESRYGNIDPFIHSTTPVGLALGPDSPRDDERGPGTLGHPADGILTRLSLLMSAFSLPRSPRRGSPGRFAPPWDALLPST